MHDPIPDIDSSRQITQVRVESKIGEGYSHQDTRIMFKGDTYIYKVSNGGEEIPVVRIFVE